MTDKEIVDIDKELDDLLTEVQPNLQDVIKRSFTNVILQQNRNGEQVKPDTLPDTSYFAKNTQVNLSRLELLKPPTFHMQSISLDLKSMALSFRCSLGEVSLKGLYSAFNENLYNLIPVLSEGHFVISLSKMCADVTVGLALEDDAYTFINPAIDFAHDEVLVKLSWPSPQRNGGYDFSTTEQLAKHIDDLPLTAAISLPLYALLRDKLQRHLSLVLRQATSVSEVMCCNPSLLEAYTILPLYYRSLATSPSFSRKVCELLTNDIQPSSECKLKILCLKKFEIDIDKNILLYDLIPSLQKELYATRLSVCHERFNGVASIVVATTMDATPIETSSVMVDNLAQSGNKIMDMILINMRRTLLQNCREILELPPLHATFLHKIGSISYIGKFETDTGWLKNLATINRTNDVSVTRPDPIKTSFHVTLRIKDFQLGYEEYRVKAMGLSCSGRVAAAFSEAVVRIAVSAGLARWEPYAQLDHLTLQTLDGMDPHITGLGGLSGAGVAALVRSWVRGACAAVAAPALVAQLQHEAGVALQELPLWDILHAKQ